MLSPEATVRGFAAFSEPEARPTERSTADWPSSGTLSTWARNRSTVPAEVAPGGRGSGSALAGEASGTLSRV